MKKALIFGVTGQDGYYLSKLLIKKGYFVHGVRRRNSIVENLRIDEIFFNKTKNCDLHYGDVTDSISTYNLIKKIKPNEIYNLAAQSHVGISFDLPEYTSNVDGIGTLNILEAIKNVNKKIKFYQASTSELFGGVSRIQNERTPFYPKSPYGVAKLYSYWITKCYRESYKMFCVNGILFNHESKFRGENFITRKVSKAVANIVCNKNTVLEVGNLKSKRDWGHAEDYVEAMWKMLQLKNPVDLVVSTGKSISIKRLIELSFNIVGIKIIWKGKNENEYGIDKKNKRRIVKINKKFFRPNEVDNLKGDNRLSKKIINFRPKKNIRDIMSEMIENDIKLIKN